MGVFLLRQDWTLLCWLRFFFRVFRLVFLSRKLKLGCKCSVSAAILALEIAESMLIFDT
jgi:hypothetical protein